ncbi:MAG TPA: ABC transporter substrate-binding protein [Candidatus Methylomirabilis sp.]|nr:ABC transporter substrate-binding protein [Candidatus Methylomirabilis sp.]
MKRLALLALGILVVASLVAGASGQDKARKAVYTVTTKNLSVALAAHSSIPLTLGYWRAEGVDIEVTSVEGSTAGLQQLAAGNIQFTTVGPEVALMAREKGVKVKSFYVVNSVTIFRVVVPRDSPIQTAADLRDKTIGVSALTSGAVPVAKAVIASGGLNPERDVKWLTVGVGAPAALAIKQKNVDAMALWGDFQASLENQGLQFREISAPFMKDLLGQIVIARDDYLAEHPDVAIAFARGLAKATLFGLTNPEAAVRMHWKMYPQTRPQGLDDARAMPEAIHVFNARFETQRVDNREDKRFGASSAAQWNRLKAIYKEQGLIQGTADVNEVFTNALIDDVNRFDQAAVIRQAKEYR